ncbi:AAA family ATPase [Litoribrevibacter albus]|uniref:Shikimate kinase n=1 Tax=Litoribrevibacter albus TaxID=1473156 RepID=A0AA37SCJ3_9GAMM|nr:AAA family ATPase [Litoribrevibacter albus]GLQ31983.1 hypothetical protein GCM10007876_24620 [Litoribrevibacter albus]
MRKIIIFGNSGSGKSTLAKELCAEHNLSHLDLDELAWMQTSPPERAPLEESGTAIQAFAATNNGWVIEGCYIDLMEIAAPLSEEIIYLNLPVELCIENAKKRPWEPHKYESKEAQDANLSMLLAWIKDYEQRQDTFSKAAHMDFYTSYPGKKTMHKDNERESELEAML